METIQNVRVGYEAVDRHGETIGMIEQVESQFFVVTKGLIFKKDVYVPFSAVNSVEYGLVRVDVDKGEIDAMGWNEPPVDAGDVRLGGAGFVSGAGSYDSVLRHRRPR